MNNKIVTLQDLLEMSANLSNSIWEMYKNGEMHTMSHADFTRMYESIGLVYDMIAEEILNQKDAK